MAASPTEEVLSGKWRSAYIRLAVEQEQPWLRTSQRTSASRAAEDLHIPTSLPVDQSQLVEAATKEGMATTTEAIDAVALLDGMFVIIRWFNYSVVITVSSI